MKFPLKSIAMSSAIALGLGLGGGYWYVFVAGAPQLDPPEAMANTGLNFQLVTFDSPAMNEVRTYGVVLPPQYNRQPHKRFPVIFLLHGGHGDATDYETKAKLTSVLHQLYQQHRLPPAIVITPDGSDRRGSSPFYDPDYYDGPNGKVASLINTDLVNVVKSRYRTLEGPQFWAIGGLSSGAWGAFNIGLRHPNQFHTLFSHSGYFKDESGPNNSPQVFVKQLPKAQQTALRVYLDAGSEDQEYLTATQQFHTVLDQLGIVNEFHVFPGGHGIVGADVGWNYWHKHLSDSLAFVGRQFKLAEQASHSSSKSPSKS